MKLIYGLCAALLAGVVQAAPDVVVSGVKMPAWVERGNVRFPVSPNLELNANDTLVTGSGARVLLKSAEGSQIKLGENARLLLGNMAQKRDGNTLFSASLDVLKGAFRFTTTALDKLRPRAVNIKVAGATIGIRGTDVWGKSGGRMSIESMEKAMGKSLNRPAQDMLDFDVVCLIEGKIGVQHTTDFAMDQPITFYVMPKGEPPMPVAALSMEQLGKWATETELDTAPGAAQTGGKWKVNLLDAATETQALTAYDELRAAGYDARILPLQNGQYRLRLTQLASRADAEAMAQVLTGKLGVGVPTVGR